MESGSDDILADAQNVDVAFLVVGDPFGHVSENPCGGMGADWQLKGDYTYRPRSSCPRTSYTCQEHSKRVDHVCRRRDGIAAL